MTYFVTAKTFEKLRGMRDAAAAAANSAATQGYQAGAEQDGYHDEGFQLGRKESEFSGSRYNQLNAILKDCQVVTPEEQANEVQLGNGVVLEFKKDDYLCAVVEGAAFTMGEVEVISSKSALGLAIMGAQVGQSRNYNIRGRAATVIIKKIFPPSAAYELVAAEQKNLQGPDVA